MALPVILRIFATLLAIFTPALLIHWGATRVFKEKSEPLWRQFWVMTIDLVLVTAAVATSASFRIHPYLAAVVCAVACFVVHRASRTGNKPPTKDVTNTDLVFTVFAIGIAFAVAFAVKATLFNAMKITDSAMRPSVVGDHLAGRCENCGHVFYVWHFGQDGVPAYPCPSCAQAAGASQSRTRGDRVLIDRLSRPERWQVAVFNSPYPDPESPGEPRKPNLTRVVGLPGERIEIISGDVFIDGNRIVKAADELSHLWFPWSDFAWGKPIPAQSPWLEETTPKSKTYRWKPLIATELFKDVDLQNIRIVTEPRPVRDVRLNVTFSNQEAGPVRLTWSYGELRATVSGQPNTPGITIDTPGKQVVIAEAKFTTALGIAFRDGVMTALADSKAVGTVDLEPHASGQVTDDSATNKRCDLVIECSQSPASATIHRDVHYLTESVKETKVIRARPGEPFTIGPNSYFVLGDESGLSEDSRHFTTPLPEFADFCQPGTLPGEMLIGVARWIYHPFSRSSALP